MLPTREKRIDYVSQLIDHYLPILKLEDWTLKVSFPEAVEGVESAACNALPEYRHANLYFTVDKLGGDPRMLANTVIHELAHAVNWPFTHMNDQFVGKDAFKKEMARLVTESVTTHWEQILSQLAPPPAPGASRPGARLRGPARSGRAPAARRAGRPAGRPQGKPSPPGGRGR